MVIIDDNATLGTASSTITVAGDGMLKLSDHTPFVRGGGGKMKRRHSVDFKAPEKPEVQDIERMDEGTRTLCWYSRDEYDIIKARNSLIVKMMKTGHFRESDEHSFRGLEHKLKEGFKQRRANKFNALNAVLEEQDRQMAIGIVEPETIARKYRRVSLNAAETAFVIGVRDAEESLCYRPGSQPTAVMDPQHHHHEQLQQHQLQHHQPPAMIEDNYSDMTPSLQGDDSYDGATDGDTIASEDSYASAAVCQTREQVRGLFAAASILKRNDGRMNRRSSL
ncbi:hypothetical protein ACA910_006115 [Epithemia clementina (nom. ined.)]